MRGVVAALLGLPSADQPICRRSPPRHRRRRRHRRARPRRRRSQAVGLRAARGRRARCRSNRCASCAPPPVRQTERARARFESSADERQAAGQDEARLFAIFLDEYHVAGGANTERVREALIRFVDRDLAPRDLRRRHEAARLAVRDPPDARSRRGAARDRDVRRTQGRLRAAQRLRARLHRRHAGAHRRRRAIRWRCRRSTRSPCISAA